GPTPAGRREKHFSHDRKDTAGNGASQYKSCDSRATATTASSCGIGRRPVNASTGRQPIPQEEKTEIPTKREDHAMPSPAVSDDVLNQLRKYDPPPVCNVIELFETRPRNTGYTDDRIKACYPALPPMVGFATTATFRAGAPPKGGDTYIGLGGQIEKIA